MYNAERTRLSHLLKEKNLADLLDKSIKWTRAVKNDFKNNKELTIQDSIIRAQYRPFVSKDLYFDKRLNEMQYRLADIYGDRGIEKVPTIVFSDPTSQKPFMTLAVDGVFDLHFVGSASGAVALPLNRLDSDGVPQDNITDWALEKFKKHYNSELHKKQPITKQAIFYYTYAVLHNPQYIKKYSSNLKRDFPYIPFYKNFWQWSNWGETLINYHLNYENIEKFPLTRNDIKTHKSEIPKTKLKADKDNGVIFIDEETSLVGIPASAWQYMLGGRSAIEWVLDQYKESKPSDSIIRNQFNTYRFSDYKEHVIEVIMRVTTVSIKTMDIVNAMAAADQ